MKKSSMAIALKPDNPFMRVVGELISVPNARGEEVEY